MIPSYRKFAPAYVWCPNRHRFLGISQTWNPKLFCLSSVMYPQNLSRCFKTCVTSSSLCKTESFMSWMPAWEDVLKRLRFA